jgi:hypothetical protein
MAKIPKSNQGTNKDMFGTPKNRSNTWDIKKSRDPKKDRRKTKKELDDKGQNSG